MFQVSNVEWDSLHINNSVCCWIDSAYSMNFFVLPSREKLNSLKAAQHLNATLTSIKYGQAQCGATHGSRWLAPRKIVLQLGNQCLKIFRVGGGLDFKLYNTESVARWTRKRSKLEYLLQEF